VTGDTPALRPGDVHPGLTVTDRLIRGLVTDHTAAAVAGGWTLTWLPGRLVTREQALAGMSLAEIIARTPPDDIGAGRWRQEWDRLAAVLELDGADAVTRASESLWSMRMREQPPAAGEQH